MSVVEVDKNGQVMVITLNRPDRLNALGFQLRSEMADAFIEFRDNPQPVSYTHLTLPTIWSV